jgi:hypothetical protein
MDVEYKIVKQTIAEEMIMVKMPFSKSVVYRTDTLNDDWEVFFWFHRLESVLKRLG